MIEIEIDGQSIEVNEGTSIIEAADKVGIPIPRFCYHKKLSVAANCRMCLVEVEKSPKPLPACATPVMPGMKVSTQSEKTLSAQKSVMEFLLANHPLDCPICDQGGECALQDFSLLYGKATSDYAEEKRAISPLALGELIQTEMTRCIHCTRCVRFGQEIAGLTELGLTHRGEDTLVQNAMQKVMHSELSGNVIDLCPVGALTAKPSLYELRSWEAFEYPTISPHDCVGSHLYVHTANKNIENRPAVYRVVPRVCEAINENWISDRDRFGYQGVNHKSRATTPLIKNAQGKWVESSWHQALFKVADTILSSVCDRHPEDMGVLVSNNSTFEEGLLLKTYAASLGIENIDSRLRMQDLDPTLFQGTYPYGKCTLPNIEKKQCILLIGVDIERESPLLAHRIRQAIKNQGTVFVLNPVNYTMHFSVAGRLCTVNLETALVALQKTLQVPSAVITGTEELRTFIADLSAALCSAKTESLIICGTTFLNHKAYGSLYNKVRHVAQKVQAEYSILTEGPNALGLYWANVLPGSGELSASPGLTAREMCIDKPRKKYVLFGMEAEHDTAYPAALLEALTQAEFTVCFTAFISEKMYDYANVILPIASFSETAGSFVNMEGKKQNFTELVPPPAQAEAGWKVIRALARVTQDTHRALSRMSFVQTDKIHALSALKKVEEALDFSPEFLENSVTTPLTPIVDTMPAEESATPINSLLRLAPYEHYSENPLLRRCSSLRKRAHTRAGARIHPSVAQNLAISSGEVVRIIQGDDVIILPIFTDPALATGILWLPMGGEFSAGFGESMSLVTLEKIEQGV